MMEEKQASLRCTLGFRQHCSYFRKCNILTPNRTAVAPTLVLPGGTLCADKNSRNHQELRF